MILFESVSYIYQQISYYNYDVIHKFKEIRELMHSQRLKKRPQNQWNSFYIFNMPTLKCTVVRFANHDHKLFFEHDETWTG